MPDDKLQAGAASPARSSGASSVGGYNYSEDDEPWPRPHRARVGSLAPSPRASELSPEAPRLDLPYVFPSLEADWTVTLPFKPADDHVWTVDELRLLAPELEFPFPDRRFSVEAFDALVLPPEDRRKYELIDGVVVVSPSPSANHNFRLLRLAVRLFPELDRLRQGSLISDTDVQLENLTVVRPDLMWVPSGMWKAYLAGEKRIQPRLVVEVLSKRTARYDRVAKKQKYLAGGTQELWLMHPDKPVIELYTGDFKVPRMLSGYEAVLRLKELPEWELSLREVYDESERIQVYGQHELERALQQAREEGKRRLDKAEQEQSFLLTRMMEVEEQAQAAQAKARAAEEKARAAEAKRQAEAEARARAESQRQAEAEARALAESQARAAESQRQAEAEARALAESQARAAESQRQAEAEARALAEAQRQAEAEARARAEARLTELEALLAAQARRSESQ